MPVFTVNAFRKINSIYTINGDASGGVDNSESVFCGAPWSASAAAALSLDAPWDQRAADVLAIAAPWSASTPQSATLEALWLLSAPLRSATRAAWGESTPDALAERMPWLSSAVHAATLAAPWGASREQDQTDLSAPWLSAAVHAQPLRAPWGASTPASTTVSAFWQALAAQGAYIAIRWGGSGQYRSGYDLPYGQALPGDPDHSYPLPNLPVYIMLPSFSVFCGGDDLQAIDVDVHFDDQSYAGTFTATIPRTTFPLVDPALFDTPQSVTVTINGYPFAMLVDGYRDNKVFGKPTYTLQGSAASKVLGPGPGYAPLRTYTETSDKNMSQLATQELADTGWTMVWAAADWLVPAGKWSYADLTPIEAIGKLASVITAVVEADPISPIVTVRPKYPTSPWSWPSATPFAIVPAALVTGVTGNWLGKNNYNGVYVSGQNGGVRVLIKLPGTDGARQMQQVTDPLIVSIAAAQERGRIELADSTVIKNVPVTMPLLPGPVTDDNPGPILPGKLLQCTDSEGQTLLGLTRALDISVRRGANDAITVRQTVSIDIHNTVIS